MNDDGHDLPADWRWHQQQRNYFYGDAEALCIDSQGQIHRRNWRLNPAPETLPAWQSFGRLGPEALSLLQSLIDEFSALEQAFPSSLIPDDFPWQCQARTLSDSLGASIHALSIYSNNPPEQLACLAKIKSLLESIK